MINVYPYPFSKNVKSLPDPPPAKAREIKDIQNKIYTNDYTWLLEAINNLKKCFHLCDLCSQKFKRMRRIARDSNVHYEHNWNDPILNHVSTNDMDGTFYKEEETNDSNEVGTDMKRNILKINGKGMKKLVGYNENIEPVSEVNTNGIIFSNSLYSNKDEILSFDKDVYIFVGDHNTNPVEKDIIEYEHPSVHEDHNHFSFSNDFCTPRRKDSKVEEMSIHIKRHFKDSISYFACEHIKFNELHNLSENSNYDKIDIFAYDKENIGSMNACVLNLRKGNDFIHLTQPINEISTNEELKEKVEEIHKFYINVINQSNDERIPTKVKNDRMIFHTENIRNVTSQMISKFGYDETLRKNKNDRFANTKDVNSLTPLSKRKSVTLQSQVCSPQIPASLIDELTKKITNRKVSCCLKDLEKNPKGVVINGTQVEEEELMKTKFQNPFATKQLHSKNSINWNHINPQAINNINSKKEKTINDVNIEEFMLKLSKGLDTKQQNIQKLGISKFTKFDIKKESDKNTLCMQNNPSTTTEDHNIIGTECESSIKESSFQKINTNLFNHINSLQIKKTDPSQKSNLQVVQPLEKNSFLTKEKCKDDFSDFSEEKINKIYENTAVRSVLCNEYVDFKGGNSEPMKPNHSKWQASSNRSPFHLNHTLFNKTKKVSHHSTNTDPIPNYNGLFRKKSSSVAVQTHDDCNFINSMCNTKECKPTTNVHNISCTKVYKEGNGMQPTIIPISLLKSSVCALKNYENSKIKNPFSEISYSRDGSSNDETKEDIMNCANNIDTSSACLNMEEKPTQETLKSAIPENRTEGAPSYQFIKKRDLSLVMSPLGKNTYLHHDPIDRVHADALCRKKESNHHDNLSFVRNPILKEPTFYNTIEKPKYSLEPNEEITREGSMDKLINMPVGKIFNLCQQPSEINVHNRIYTSDVNQSFPDTKKVIYFNNNYFFNIDKESSVEKNTLDLKLTNENKSCNFKKDDVEMYERGNDRCGVKYCNNTLSNDGTLIKESFLDTSLGASTLNENIAKLQKLRNRHFRNNDLQHILHKKKSPMSKRFWEIKKNYYPYQKSFTGEDKHIMKEHMCNEHSRKNRANPVTMICDVPESPQEQDKIPKPLASQLDIQVQAYFKKTPSYPFEEYEF